MWRRMWLHALKKAQFQMRVLSHIIIVVVRAVRCSAVQPVMQISVCVGGG